MVEQVGEEVVIMATSTADVYTLNATGAALWNSLFEGREVSLKCLISMGFSEADAELHYASFVDSLISTGIVKCTTL